MANPEGGSGFSIVIEPKGDPRLEGFSTGSSKEWEEAVNRLVAELYSDGAGAHPGLTLLAMADSNADTIGLCAWKPKELAARREGTFGMRPRIHLIGINEKFRRPSREPGSPNYGTLLLRRALAEIRSQHGGLMPEVWALVGAANGDAHRLFDHRDFDRVAPDRRYRGPNLRIR